MHLCILVSRVLSERWFAVWCEALCTFRMLLLQLTVLGLMKLMMRTGCFRRLDRTLIDVWLLATDVRMGSVVFVASVVVREMVSMEWWGS